MSGASLPAASFLHVADVNERRLDESRVKTAADNCLENNNVSGKSERDAEISIDSLLRRKRKKTLLIVNLEARTGQAICYFLRCDEAEARYPLCFFV